MNRIEFVSTIPGLIGQDDDEVLPRESYKLKPSWWKNAPYDHSQSNYQPQSNLIRRCPGFADLFESGYILPMWADTTIYFNKLTKQWKATCGQEPSPFKINCFDPKSFTDNGKFYLNGINATAIFQFHSPWVINAPKNVSMFQMPLYYDHSKGFGVMPGTFDADITDQSKIEVGYFTNDEEIFIKKGTPLIQYIPYKKIDHNFVVREMTKRDKDNQDSVHIRSISSFAGWYRKNYRRNSAKSNNPIDPQKEL